MVGLFARVIVLQSWWYLSFKIDIHSLVAMHSWGEIHELAGRQLLAVSISSQYIPSAWECCKIITLNYTCRFPWHKSMALLYPCSFLSATPISGEWLSEGYACDMYICAWTPAPSPCSELEIEFLADFRNPLLDYLQILRRTVRTVRMPAATGTIVVLITTTLFAGFYN